MLNSDLQYPAAVVYCHFRIAGYPHESSGAAQRNMEQHWSGLAGHWTSIQMTLCCSPGLGTCSWPRGTSMLPAPPSRSGSAC